MSLSFATPTKTLTLPLGLLVVLFLPPISLSLSSPPSCNVGFCFTTLVSNTTNVGFNCWKKKLGKKKNSNSQALPHPAPPLATHNSIPDCKLLLLCSSSSWRRWSWNSTISTSKDSVLILPSKISTLKTQRFCKLLLNVVGDFMAGLPTSTSHFDRQLLKERDFVAWSRVHEEEERVHALPASSSSSVKQLDLDVHRHGYDLVRKLRKQRAKPQQKRFSTSGPLWTDGQIPLLQECRHGLCILVATSRQSHCSDRC